ncbi:UPF0147 family protein [archaeon]|nr:UPF0147 family protein [archaeon]
MKEKLKQIANVLGRIVEDSSVPRNIRRSAEEAKALLLNEDEDVGMRISSAIYLLEEISNDRNLPIHARTVVWNVASELETFRLG